MPISKELLEILACPMCKKDVIYKKDADFFRCAKCDVRYPADKIKSDIATAEQAILKEDKQAILKENMCPKCKGKMEKIKGEVLTCVECKRWYPVIDDIPHMLPDELREDLV